VNFTGHSGAGWAPIMGSSLHFDPEKDRDFRFATNRQGSDDKALINCLIGWISLIGFIG